MEVIYVYLDEVKRNHHKSQDGNDGHRLRVSESRLLFGHGRFSSVGRRQSPQKHESALSQANRETWQACVRTRTF
ncbi:MAG: hypothetical protein MZU97_06955 [Bacillus subtilis]|nr:hypothetical protein [Bacillus subtilis]